MIGWLGLSLALALAADDPCAARGLELFGHVDLVQVQEDGYWRARDESKHLTLQRAGGTDVQAGVRRGQQVCVGDSLVVGLDVRAHVVSRWNDQIVLEADSAGTFKAPAVIEQVAGNVLYYLGHPFRVLAGRTELVNEGTRFLVRGAQRDVFVAEGSVRIDDARRVERKELAPLNPGAVVGPQAVERAGEKARALSRVLRPPRLAFGLDGTVGLIGLRGRAQTFAGPRLRLEVAPIRYLGVQLTVAYHLGGALSARDLPSSHLMFSAGLGVRVAGLGLWATYDGALVQTECACDGGGRVSLASGVGGTVRYTWWVQKHVGVSVDGRVGWTDVVTGGIGAGVAWGW